MKKKGEENETNQKYDEPNLRPEIKRWNAVNGDGKEEKQQW